MKVITPTLRTEQQNSYSDLNRKERNDKTNYFNYQLIIPMYSENINIKKRYSVCFYKGN